MADDASKPKIPAEEANAPSKRRVFPARPQPEQDPFEAGRDFMDSHPKLMARLAE